MANWRKKIKEHMKPLLAYAAEIEQ